MNYRAQLACAWIGIAATAVMFIGMWPLMHFLPPLDPGLSAAEVAAIYRANATGIIAGGLCLLLAVTAMMPFFGLLAMQLTRMEAPSRLWTYAMLTSSVLGFFTVLVADFAFSAAAYRPERPDVLIQLMSDFGFFIFVGPSLPGTLQMLSSAIPVLADRSPDPVFPRWVGYANVWTAVMATPGCLVTLFKHGPFAWNGAISFWVAAFAFGIWMNVNFWAMRRAILRQMSGVRP